MSINWRWISAATLGLCVVVACGVVGCVNVRHEADVYPDGSGRIHVRVSVPEADVARTEWAEATVDALPGLVATHCDGLVAVTDAKLVRANDRLSVEFVGWFDDADDVHLRSPDQAGLRLQRRREATSFVLEAEPILVRDIAHEAVKFLGPFETTDGADPAAGSDAREEAWARALERWRSAFGGLELTTEIRLPGRIESVEGFERVDERTVSIRLTGSDSERVGLMRSVEAQTYRVSCDTSLVSEAQAKAFADQLTAAKEAWQANPASWEVRVREAGRARLLEEFDSLDVLPGGSHLLHSNFGDSSGGVAVTDASGEKRVSIGLADIRHPQVLVSPDGARVHVAGVEGGPVQTYLIASGKQAWKFAGSEGSRRTPGSVLQTPGGDLVVETWRDGDAALEVLDGTSGAVRRTLPFDPLMTLFCATDAPPRIVGLHLDAPGFHVLDADSGERIWHHPATIDGQRTIDGEPVRGWMAEPVRGGNFLFVTTAERALELSVHDAESGELRWRMSGPYWDAYTHPAAPIVVLAGSRGTLRAVDVESGRDLGRMTPLPPDVEVLAVDARGAVWLNVVEEDDEYVARYEIQTR